MGTLRIAVILAAGCCLAVLPDRAFAGRREVSLNEGWSGAMTPEAGEVRSLERIDLPHNWDDYHGYRHWHHGNQHGSAVYSRLMTVGKKEGERYFLVFEGAGSYLTVRVNGNEVCTKRPASRLVVTVEVTAALVDGENRIEVVCDHPSEIKDLPWVCGGCSGCTCESPGRSAFSAQCAS